MNLFNILLTVHLFAVAFWIGGAIYERIFLAGNIIRNRGTGQEISLLRIMLSTEFIFLGATLLVLLTGIGMSIVSGAGFFHLSWLGLKQAIMIMIIIGFMYFIGPRMKKLKDLVKKADMVNGIISDEDYKRLHQMLTGFDVVHAAVLVNFILAIWKPL
jgi:uncharacterized membrane protein